MNILFHCFLLPLFGDILSTTNMILFCLWLLKVQEIALLLNSHKKNNLLYISKITGYHLSSSCFWTSCLDFLSLCAAFAVISSDFPSSLFRFTHLYLTCVSKLILIYLNHHISQFLSSFCFCFLKIGSHNLNHTGMKLAIFLTQLPKFWDKMIYQHIPILSVVGYLGFSIYT